MSPDLLAQLRDIHTSPPVPWWPPALGWWLLTVLLLLALFWFGRRGLARYRDQKRRKQMLAWVDHLNHAVDAEREPQVWLATLNRIFKLVALRAFPNEHCAQLAGQDWVEFLVRQMGDLEAVDSLAVLASGPYDPAPEFDALSLSKLARLWIRRHG
jgi:hypothetical protein